MTPHLDGMVMLRIDHALIATVEYKTYVKNYGTNSLGWTIIYVIPMTPEYYFIT